jgi:HD-GYP domain-containing protein (c-di-GMP phosphodiesterase class II)
MRLISTKELKGGEILARAIVTEDYNELLSEGTELKEEYVEKLLNLGISEIYISDENDVSDEDIEILKEEVKEKCKEQIQTIISRHTFSRQSEDMVVLCETADDIINTIMEDDAVVERIYDIKAHKADIFEHSINVCSLSILTALKLGLQHSNIRDIGIGCLLHDIGLKYITVDYLDIDIKYLDNKRQTEYKKHPIYGYDSVQEEAWLPTISKDIILGHHERLDGSGYPLHTKDQPVEQRIVAVCDFFDEAICGIGYDRQKVYKIIEYLKMNKGTIFDSNVINAMFKFIAVYPARSIVKLNTGETAMVVKQNNGFPERPVLQLVKNSSGEDVSGEIVIDMLKQNNVFIDEVID